MTTPALSPASEIRTPTVAAAAAVLAVPLVTIVLGLAASVGASGGFGIL